LDSNPSYMVILAALLRYPLSYSLPQDFRLQQLPCMFTVRGRLIGSTRLFASSLKSYSHTFIHQYDSVCKLAPLLVNRREHELDFRIGRAI
jgi:hypothetical protein